MSERNLFVSFAESDGGHSYLATRAMLKASSIGHLIFRTTVSDALDAVIAGQANAAVVPLYNSITQWDGATLKALASGSFEIFGQICMPTSYVLAAHKEYMQAIVDRYQQLSDKDEKLSPERAKKIYARFLTRIFVGAQAEDQYRGRLVRPDMAQATIEHTRNPLRVLEEIARNELINEIKTGTSRHGRSSRDNGMGGQIILDYPVRQTSISELNVPATLIAAGLLDTQQDPDGWDRHGSVGEIVSVLRNLLELLDVYAFGAPDLPNNKTQYILIGKKGEKISQDKLNLPGSSPPMRIMTLIRSAQKQSSADLWLKPRAKIAEKLSGIGYTLDRAPISVPGPSSRQFLIEGGKVKNAPAKPTARWGKENKKSAKEIVEFKPEKKKGGKPAGVEFTGLFLGEYPTWCPQHDGSTTHSCAVCEEAYPEKDEKKEGLPLWAKALVGGIILMGLAVLGYTMVYCPLTGCGVTDTTSSYSPPTAPLPQAAEPAAPPAPPPPSVKDTAPHTKAPVSTSYPGVKPTAAPTAYPGVPSPAPVATKPVPPPVVKAPVRTTPPPVTQPTAQPAAHTTPPQATTRPSSPRETVVRPIMLHVAFMEAKSNLSRDAFNTLTAAASHAMQLNRTVNVRIFALGQRETDQALWQRRLYAVKDELVRLGVPVERIRSEGTGPYLLVIRGLEPVQPKSAGERTKSDLDTVADPLSND